MAFEIVSPPNRCKIGDSQIRIDGYGRVQVAWALLAQVGIRAACVVMADETSKRIAFAAPTNGEAVHSVMDGTAKHWANLSISRAIRTCRFDPEEVGGIYDIVQENNMLTFTLKNR